MSGERPGNEEAAEGAAGESGWSTEEAAAAPRPEEEVHFCWMAPVQALLPLLAAVAFAEAFAAPWLLAAAWE